MDNKIIDEQTLNSQIKDIESAIKKAMGSSNAFRVDSLTDYVSDTKEKILDLVSKSTVINDTTIKDRYGNQLSSIGENDVAKTFTNYGFSADTLDWPLWLALYNDSWVFRRAIDKPAQDEIAAGFTIHGNNDYSKVYKLYNKNKSQLTDLLRWGALFGGSIAVFLFDNISNEELAQPLNKEKIKGHTFKLYVTDRWYGIAPSVSNLVENMKDIDFGKPKYYDIVMADGTQWKVHHSYVLRYEHRTAPNLIKNGYLQGWGYAEGSHIINELARDDQLKSSITSLVNKALIEVIKMAGMRGVFMGTDVGSTQQLQKRLEMVNWGRTFNSLTFLDKDDDYQQYQMTGLSGLSELLEKNMWIVSAALEMQGVLFGDLKGGLSQESDAWRRYSQTIYNRCDTYYRPIVQKYLTIVYIICDIEETPDFDFDYLDKDERNNQKVQGINNLSQMLVNLNQNGIISKYQFASTIKDYINGDILNLSFNDELLNVLRLEEQQALIDTISDIGKKRNVNVNYNNMGEVNMSQPFTSREEMSNLESKEMNEAPSMESESEEQNV